MNKFKKYILGISLIGIAAFSFAFKQSYFEVSKNIDIFTSLYKEVNTYYVEDVEASQLMRTGIDAMLKSLDPYTNFISEAEIEDYRIQVTGEYGGIGAGIARRDGFVYITEPYEGFPAQVNDVRAGDKLLEADGKSLKNKTSDEVSKALKGQAGTEILLKIERDGQILEKKLTRAEIKMKNVPYYGMINENTGYIVLTEFRNNAGKDVGNALLELKKNTNFKYLILDLRGNPGGLLHEAVNVVNVFVPQNQLVVSTIGKAHELDKEYRTLNNAIDAEIPLVVLVNNRSASASEIVSGTLQDLDRAVIVGQKSYGKGLVQSTKPLTFGTQLKITTQKYYLPSKRCIQAIDYGKHDENGKPLNMTDSAHAQFKTRNGRLVTDGKGIEPDIKAGNEKVSEISKSLISNYIIFDFATKYRNSHESISNAQHFKLSETEWNSFVEFVEKSDVSYKTPTEKELEILKQRAEEDGYFEALSGTYNQMKSNIESSKKADINKYKAEIIKFLEKEITSRYYFEKAEYESAFNKDEDIQASIEILKDNKKMKTILGEK